MTSFNMHGCAVRLPVGRLRGSTLGPLPPSASRHRGRARARTQRTWEPTSFLEGMGLRGCQDVAIGSITRRPVSRRRSFILLPWDDFLRHAWICSKAACRPPAKVLPGAFALRSCQASRARPRAHTEDLRTHQLLGGLGEDAVMAEEGRAEQLPWLLGSSEVSQVRWPRLLAAIGNSPCGLCSPELSGLARGAVDRRTCVVAPAAVAARISLALLHRGSRLPSSRWSRRWRWRRPLKTSLVNIVIPGEGWNTTVCSLVYQEKWGEVLVPQELM
ncbi:uncharacterized protein [Castor canadensis]|uniref:Uncharacterized protein n=1 Tax=Castor canadensis TaxID=51338 RepID=A0AC58JYL7_CASCN